jgi:hypothetical protein
LRRSNLPTVSGRYRPRGAVLKTGLVEVFICSFQTTGDELLIKKLWLFYKNTLMAQYTKQFPAIGLKTSKPHTYITANHFRVTTLKWAFSAFRQFILSLYTISRTAFLPVIT